MPKSYIKQIKNAYIWNVIYPAIFPLPGSVCLCSSSALKPKSWANSWTDWRQSTSNQFVQTRFCWSKTVSFGHRNRKSWNWKKMILIASIFKFFQYYSIILVWLKKKYTSLYFYFRFGVFGYKKTTSLTIKPTLKIEEWTFN